MQLRFVIEVDALFMIQHGMDHIALGALEVLLETGLQQVEGGWEGSVIRHLISMSMDAYVDYVDGHSVVQRSSQP